MTTIWSRMKRRRMIIQLAANAASAFSSPTMRAVKQGLCALEGQIQHRFIFSVGTAAWRKSTACFPRPGRKAHITALLQSLS